ncbi:Crp/Fnr family transcriptional regulator [Wenzhouxiangella sp. XN201]|uniref:Crp/Fnr family transcriptional regulator n=1 Tax=Wenzhouxiangella sp. XN201 TaxID=2710755 RepID=UPI0013C6D481|nr:Crp/Fnr family transcriptional regulator [Wenzhouxiangella sp. XN201]NEZ03958.1 Crp/Fnr family transcriptional regulator [Wenzhouxiangella sp. XN201]
MQTGPERNHLLTLFPQRTKDRIFPLLRAIELPAGSEIYAAGQVEEYVYFPADCIISLLYVIYDGHSTEISVVGRDGILGVAALMGGESTNSQAVVQVAGTAYRMNAADLKREFRNDAILRMLMLRYTQALITQMGQTAACNRHHRVDQQLARWLLLCLDRLPTNELTMTQEQISNMLGVRREGVTESARKLASLGVIKYQRRRITVLDRWKLEQLSCECYGVVKKETDRLVA